MAETGISMTLAEEGMVELTVATLLAIAVLVIQEMIILAVDMAETAIILTDLTITQQRITKDLTTPIWATETMRELITIMKGREIQI